MKPRLTIHVGMGKTGSSSIQSTLHANRLALKRRGIKYLGLMFEHADPKLFKWQKASEWSAFHSIARETANEQLTRLCRDIHENRPADITHFVWSNETLLGNFDFLSPTLTTLADLFDVDIIGYIRRPDALIASAYAQWGIKHKTYRGQLRRFGQWVKDRGYSWGPEMRKWMTAFPNSHFYNFDAIEDVCAHFTGLLAGGEISDFEMLRNNETPSPVALALWAYHNSTQFGQIRPEQLGALLTKSGVDSELPGLGQLNRYFPTEEDIRQFLQRSKGELSEVNDILRGMGEQEIDVSEVRFRNFAANQSEINRAFMQILVYLWERIELLERRLSDDDESRE